MTPSDEPRINLVVVQVVIAAIGIGTPIFWSYATSRAGGEGGSGIAVFYLSLVAALGVALLAARRKRATGARVQSFAAHVFVYLAALLLVGGGLFMLMVR